MEHEAGPAKNPGALPDATSTLQESRPVSAARCIIEHALSFGLAGPPIAGFFALIGISIIIGIAIGFQEALSGFPELTSYLFFGSYYIGAVPAVLTGIVTVPISRTLDEGPRLYAVMALIGWAISSTAVYIIYTLIGPDMAHPNAAVVFMIGGSAAMATLICTRMTRRLRSR